jgi:hypothetical protein
MKRILTICAFTGGMLMASLALARQPELVPPSPGPLPIPEPENHAADPLLDSDGTAELHPDSEPSWDYESPSCDCESGCCNSNGYGNGWGMGNCLGDCCLGEAWKLSDCLTPCCECGPTYGGWISAGYYNHNERISFDPGDELAYNDFPHHLNLDQAWFYVEKLAEANGCCADYGYRVDMMYGAQGHAAQSFGNDGGTWDVTWDHGVYEWAIPQLYGEVAFGDWNVKVGHFFTPAGYEVIPATGNFFYSHSLTNFNSEPFTHTGVLGTYSGNDRLTLYTGWVLGWDTGFDQFGAGNAFLGGFGWEATDDVTFTYILTAGNLGWRSGNEDGFSQHIVTSFTLSECMTYVLASDYITTNGTLADSTYENEDKSVVNYLIYNLNDCWGIGGRAEWWKTNNLVLGDDVSFYEITGGINYRPHANLVVRPEIRYDWTPAADTVNAAVGDNYNQTWFGVDAVLTF